MREKKIVGHAICTVSLFHRNDSHNTSVVVFTKYKQLKIFNMQRVQQPWQCLTHIIFGCFN